MTTNLYTGPMVALSAESPIPDGFGMFIESTVDLVNWGPYPGLTQYVISSNEVRYVIAGDAVERQLQCIGAAVKGDDFQHWCGWSMAGVSVGEGFVGQIDAG
jgi:hypothetical protein